MVRNPFRQAAILRLPSLHHEHPSYKWWVLANVMISTFMAVLMSTIVNGALPNMMNAFGVNLDAIQWVLTAYLLVFAIMLPLSAWLADSFGFKLVFLIALVLFTVGSFLCFVAWDIGSLIFFRIVQGVGGGVIMPLGMAVITKEFPREQRGLAMGFWSIASAASQSFGPSIGGYLIDNFGWRSTFLINLPVGLLAVAATLVIQREFRHEKRKPFDLAGFVLVCTTLVSLLLALTDGNSAWNTDGWSAPFIRICFLIAGLSLAAFIFVELRVEFPLVDLRLLKDVNLSISNAVMFLLFVGLLGSTFLLPLYFQVSLNYSAFEAGLLFLPLGLMQALFSPVAGVLGAKMNMKVPALIGVFLLGVSLLLNTLLSSDPGPFLIYFPILLRGMAYGLIFTPMQVMAVNSLPASKLAQGAGLINLIRQVGGSFGVAIFGLLLAQRNLFHTTVAGEGINVRSDTFSSAVGPLHYAIMNNTGVSSSSAVQLSQTMIAQTLVKNAYIQAICDVFFIVAVVSLFCMIPILLMKETKKNR